MTQILEALRPLAVPIASLSPDPANARTHDAKNLGAIQASLAKFGQRKPIVVQRQGMVVRAGNGTLAAAKALGWTEIAAVVVDESDIEATGYAIADNRTTDLSSFDDEVLGQLLAALDADPDFDATLTGFTAAEIERLQKPAEGLVDPDEIPEPPAEPVSRPGDLLILGEHRLLCGDSLNPDDVARLLDGAKPEFLVTDPPYGVSFDAEWRDRAGLNQCGPAEPSYMQRPAAHERQEGHKNTTISGDTIADWSPAFELVPSIRVAYVWHASSYSVDVGAGLRRIGFDLRQQLLWRKPHFVLSRTHYHYQSEPCWYAVRRGATSAWVGTRDQSNIWDAPSPKMLMNAGGNHEEKFDHPTQKPMLCMETPLQNHDLAEVYEPFGGSGTTLIACERRRKRCFAMEIDPKYIDVIVARWEGFTGKKAERVRA
ncbi:MAG: ParB N-terminal domain-containing protein [Planctomycetes bacterium]|nr:ParB N-terminal domain-containing protein [Planctomycetota bacterium]